MSTGPLHAQPTRHPDPSSLSLAGLCIPAHFLVLAAGALTQWPGTFGNLDKGAQQWQADEGRKLLVGKPSMDALVRHLTGQRGIDQYWAFKVSHVGGVHATPARSTGYALYLQCAMDHIGACMIYIRRHEDGRMHVCMHVAEHE